MRRGLIFAATTAMLWSVGSAGLAEEAKPDKGQTDAAVKATADAPTVAQLRARLHRATAALIEAQAAEEPDLKKVERLTRRIDSLRAQVRDRRAPAPYDAPAGWRRSGGGPGLGYGAGWGGPGLGRPRGAGRGYGRGPGWGQGRGYGRGPGWGQGRGRGWGFVDKDRNGVCDNYESPQAVK